MTKLKLLTLLIPILLAFLNSNAQYKDLEGVFFGKVIALGAGASIHGYSDKEIGTTSSITAINYSVLLSKKTIVSSRLAFHKKFSVVFTGDDFSTPYTQTAEFKFTEFEAALKFSLTTDGTEKPTSVFLSLQTGILFGKQKTIDSRYGEIDDDDPTKAFFGGGLTLYQRVGSRFILYAEPAYRYVFEPVFKTYLGDNLEKQIKFNHYSVNLGILFLIGKSNN
jgi:hypothetical protein